MKALVLQMKDTFLKEIVPTSTPEKIHQKRKKEKKRNCHHHRKHVEDQPSEDEPEHLIM